MAENAAARVQIATEEKAVSADNTPPIPGLGLIEPDFKTEASENPADVSNGVELLDALMQHVDSQSNVQALPPRQPTHSIPDNVTTNDDTTVEPLVETVVRDDRNEHGQHTSDRPFGTSGRLDDDDQLRNAKAMMDMSNRGSTEEGTTDAANQLVTNDHQVGAYDTITMPVTDTSTIQKVETTLTGTTAETNDQVGDVQPARSQPGESHHLTVLKAPLNDSEDKTSKEEDGNAERNGVWEEKDVIKGGTPFNEEVNSNLTPAKNSDGASPLNEGFAGVDQATLNEDTKEAAVLEDHAKKEAPQESYPNQSGRDGATIEAEVKLAPQNEEGIIQYNTTERTEHAASPQQGKTPLAILEDPIPNVTSLREELPSVNNSLQAENTQEGEGAEWEVDSSPLDSSSDSDTTSDTSTDDSDEDDADVDGDYAMLDPEEQARILMQGEGGSDDEGNTRNGAKGEAAQLRTANEKPEEIVPKPDIKVTEDMEIQELGVVEAIVEKTVLVKAKVSGDYCVLENNSLLCLQDRTVVGIVSETLGRVEQPLYTIRFTNDEAIKDAGLAEKNTPVYYVEKHSTFVFTQPLRAVKGSDASNFHDEEVAADEMEFSDDEAEAEHKRQIKLKKQGRKDDRNDRFANSRGRRGGHMNGASRMNGDGNVMEDTAGGINYDDIPPMGDDGYIPLARPTNLHEMMGRGEAPLEGREREPAPPFSDRGHDRGRGRGRGRGDRGGRGGRGGRGRGGWDRSSNNKPRERSESFSSRPPVSPVAKSESSSAPIASTYAHHQQQQPLTPTFALPPIPPPSQYPYPQIPPQRQPQPYPPTPSLFSYPNQIQTPTAPPQAPTITPQPSSYPTFSPSPISPLPQGHFNFNNYANQYNQQQQQHASSSTQPAYGGYQPQQAQQSYQNQNQNASPNSPWRNPMFCGGQGHQQEQAQAQMPPPGSHINPAFFEALRQQRERENGGWQSGRR